MSDESQHNAQLEGLAIGLEQRGEVSAAHVIRLALKRLQLDAEADARPDPIKRWDGKFKGGSTSTIVDQSGPISDQDAMSDDIKDIKIGGISPSEYVRGIKNGNIDPTYYRAIDAILWAADEIERLREENNKLRAKATKRYLFSDEG